MSKHHQPAIPILLVLFLSLLAFLPIAASASRFTLTVDLATDKACYAPGEPVVLTATGTVPDRTMVRYCHGTTVVASHPFAAKTIGNTWTWQPPTDDFKGYLVELYINDGDQKTILGTIAVDVSSDWTRFPRYGFVADFEEYGNAEQKTANIYKEMAYLNRCHINGVQFQDWQWKHHRPVCLNAEGSLAGWYQDISNRWVGTAHIKKYIEVQHSYGMKSIFYNLCFGAWSGASADGVKEAWNLYAQDETGKHYQDFHGLPSTWQSNIYLEDPGNSAWQQYMADRNEEVYAHFGFDGYQIDQLGHRGTRYDAAGNVVDLPAGYASFIRAMKERHPERRLVMNAVSGYGAEQIAGTGKVDFCYNEVWGNGNGYGGVPEDQFANLYAIIRNNDRFSDHGLRTVFAAYMNYNKADNGGSGDKMMNTPGVLLTDAVMFALGGSHLELGDHMLSREYFPAAPLAMTDELKTAMIRYYDFMTAYQNWLREKSSKFDFTANVTTSQTDIRMAAWPPKADAVVTFAKKVGTADVIHFLNFRGTDDLSWRDLNGTRQTPPLTQHLPVTVDVATKIGKLWVASPDIDGGAPRELPFTQVDGKVTFTLPTLLYWTMVVMEGTSTEDQLRVVGDATPGGWDTGKATVLQPSAEEGIFESIVDLEANKPFKFINGTDYGTCLHYNAEYEDFCFNEQYNINSANLLVNSNADYGNGSDDYKFTVDQTGRYRLTLDLRHLRIKVERMAPAAIGVAEYTTGCPGKVSELSPLKSDAGICHTITGYRITQPRKGIYIVDGRKKIVR